MMCRLLGVSRNAYYRYCQQDRQTDPEHRAILSAVKEIAETCGDSYGSRRMRRALNALGYPVGRRKARSLMQEADFKANYRKKYKVTTNSNQKQPVFDNVLNREFETS